MKQQKELTESSNKDANTKSCFVIMPISDADDYKSGHFARVYKYIIAPACRKAGYDPTLASDVKSANMIVVDILKRILNADMVLCDLSSRNPNVLYELGIRQSFDLPVALIKDNKTKETFDIQGIRYYEYDVELRYDLVEVAVDAIAEILTETYENKDKDVFSLVQILGRDKASIKQSDISSDTIAILEAIKEIRNNPNRQEDLNKSTIIIPESELADISRLSPVNALNIRGKEFKGGELVNHKNLGFGKLYGFSKVNERILLVVHFDSVDRLYAVNNNDLTYL